MRPRKLRRLLAAVGIGACVAGAGLAIVSPKAEAVPGECASGFGAGFGGGLCDLPPRADSSWLHCESLMLFGIGGSNCFFVRPVPVDVDPRGWVPA